MLYSLSLYRCVLLAHNDSKLWSFGLAAVRFGSVRYSAVQSALKAQIVFQVNFGAH